MNKLPWMIVSLASSCLLGSSVGSQPACTPPASATLANVPFEGQETGSWCWAASGQITMNFVHKDSKIEQCEQVHAEYPHLKKLHPPVNCCVKNAMKPPECSLTGLPEYEKFDFHADIKVNKAMLWSEIKKSIGCNNSPIAFSWKYEDDDDNGHMMVAYGYHVDGNTKLVEAIDPIGGLWNSTTDSYLPSYEIYTYQQYKKGPEDTYKHWNDYYNIKYTGG